MKRVLTTISLSILAIGLIVTEARGEGSADKMVSIGDGIVCAAIVPCDDNGQVLPAFAVGDCAEYYQGVCELERSKTDFNLGKHTNQDLVTCNGQVNDLVAENKKLLKKNRALNRLAQRNRK